MDLDKVLDRGFDKVLDKGFDKVLNKRFDKVLDKGFDKGLLAAVAGLLGLLLSCPVTAQAPSTLDQALDRAYRLEKATGDIEGALSAYRALLDDEHAIAAGAVPRVLHGVARCAEKLGRISEARRAWLQITEAFPSDTRWVALAQEELRRVSVLTERVRLEGVILDEHGYPVHNAYVLIGTWVFEPPVLTDEAGRFTTERKVRRDSFGDMRYCLLYAEHPYRRVAAADVIPVDRERAVRVTIRLKPMTSLQGFVKRRPDPRVGSDQDGNRMPRERVFVSGADVTVQGVAGEYPKIRIPFDLIIPARQTDGNGQYVLSNLVSGLRYRIHAGKPGFSLEESAEVLARESITWVPDTILVERGSSRLSGRVTDASGMPVRADVSVFTMVPESRWIESTRTDADGFYELDRLPAAKLVVRARTTSGHAARTLTGVESDRDDVHFTLRNEPPLEPSVNVGEKAPEIRVHGVNTVPPRLAHFSGSTVLVYFWRRARLAEPPRELSELVAAHRSQGLKVICIHDHSGFTPELAELAHRRKLPYRLAIDRYAHVRDPEAYNSATMGQYGLAKGDTILLDASARVLAQGSLDQLAPLVAKFLPDRGESTQSEPTEDGRAEGLSSGDEAPPLRVRYWVRGEPINGGPVVLSDLRGQTVIIHFSSIYLASSATREQSSDRRSVEQVLSVFRSKGVTAVWILPSSDELKEAERFTRARPGEVPIGIDQSSETYKAYGISDLSESCVVGPDGKVLAQGIRDNELFRVTKELLGL